MYNPLPQLDNRPISSLCVVEEISGCPPNFTVISKTHDQDLDADLAKDGFFKRVKRYICHSKTEGFMGYIVENISIIGDKDARPAGYTLLEQTKDTGQRTFRKKQFCYRAVPRHMASQTITDIIVLSQAKVAPNGFILIGDMNGLSLCLKLGSPPPSPVPGSMPSLPYGMDPGSRGSAPCLYPGVDGSGSTRLHAPARPAPLPPGYSPQPTMGVDPLYDAISSPIANIPFTLNKKYVHSDPEGGDNDNCVSMKNAHQIQEEYHYSFAVELDVINRTT